MEGSIVFQMRTSVQLVAAFIALDVMAAEQRHLRAALPTSLGDTSPLLSNTSRQ